MKARCSPLFLAACTAPRDDFETHPMEEYLGASGLHFENLKYKYLLVSHYPTSRPNAAHPQNLDFIWRTYISMAHHYVVTHVPRRAAIEPTHLGIPTAALLHTCDCPHTMNCNAGKDSAFKLCPGLAHSVHISQSCCASR
jgi:hypothetical protein